MIVTLIGKPSVNAEDLCGIAAGVCTDSADTKRSLRGSLASGHESVIEHACYTFYIQGVSRVTLAQLTRHRIASYSVKSQRYCKANGQCVIPQSLQVEPDINEVVSQHVQNAMNLYNTLLKWGVKPEDARYILPEGSATDIVMTMNARELKHFFRLRCCNRAQWEIRALAEKMLQLCLAESPMIFKDAGPGCVRGKCPEGSRSCGHPKKSCI